MGEEWSGRAGNGGGDGIHVTQAKVVAVRVSPSSSLAVERDGPHSLSLSLLARQTESPLSCNSNTT